MMYGIEEDEDIVSDDDDADDVEAAVRKEAVALKSKGVKGPSKGYFTPLRTNVDCLVFFKTKSPIEPVEFVRRICADAKARKEPGQFRCRYVNRLTPVTVIGKASTAGLLEVARRTLAPHFKLSAKRTTSDVTDGSAPREEEGQVESGVKPASEDQQDETSAVKDAVVHEFEPVTVSRRRGCWVLSIPC